MGKFLEVKKLETDSSNPDFVFLNKKEDVIFKGQKIGYTSPQLRKLILRGLNEKNIVNESLKDLINKGLIVIFMYFDNNKQLQTWKLLPIDKYIKAVWGWFTGKANGNRIFISINSVQHLDGMVIMKDLKKLMVHELCHFFFVNFHLEFKSNFHDILTDFYTHFIHKYLGYENIDDIPKENIDNLVNTLIDNELDEKGEKVINYVENLYNSLASFVKNNPEKEKLIDYIIALLSDQSNIYYKLKKDKDANGLQKALHYAYIEIQKKYTDIQNPERPPNFVFQELLYPSEVIAVFSQFSHKTDAIQQMMGIIRDNQGKIIFDSEN